MIGLYIHIPFCKTLCTYCDFAKEIASEDKQTLYLKALEKELDSYKDHFKLVRTIYVGGGTPSALSDRNLTYLLTMIQSKIDLERIVEYTFESNPNDISETRAHLYRKYGVNRVSLGVQSFNRTHLNFLNRTHQTEDVNDAIKYLKAANISNISIDMMFSIVNQTVSDVKDDLQAVLDLNVPHISYYSLILETRTPLYQKVLQGQAIMNDNDIEGDMYETIIDTLSRAGYKHYEISNFAKHDLEALHNKIYWTNQDFIGVGAGSHGKLKKERYYNVRSVKKYIEKVQETGKGMEDTYPYEGLRDAMLMGLRLMDGIHVSTMNRLFSTNIFEKYPDLNRFVKTGYLDFKRGYLKFTRKGLLLGNHIFEVF